MKAEINIEKLICHILQCCGADDIKKDGSVCIETADILNALHAQGLEYKDGKIQEFDVPCQFKKGDILADRNHDESVCIFRRALKDDDGLYVSAYCGTFVGNGQFTTSDEEEVWGDVEEMVPATAVQRDMLFYEMKKSGYVWDSEKLKLVKLEP